MLGLFDGLNLTETLQMSYDINLPEWVYTRGYVLWGVVPYIAVNIGFWSTVILLETVVALETGTPIECTYCAPYLKTMCMPLNYWFFTCLSCLIIPCINIL